MEQQIVKSAQIEIIPSLYNWAGLFNKHYRVSVEYYLNLQIQSGNYLNLIVPEASENLFSLYDMDELDKLILDFLSEPLSIEELLSNMQVCFDDVVIENHYQSYVEAIVNALKQLTVRKAIQPVE